MTPERNVDYLVSLVRELCKLPAETSWLEFKRNNADPLEVGEYLAALSMRLRWMAKAVPIWSGAWTTRPTKSWERPSYRRLPRKVMKSWKAGCCACLTRVCIFVSIRSK